MNDKIVKDWARMRIWRVFFFSMKKDMFKHECLRFPGESWGGVGGVKSYNKNLKNFIKIYMYIYLKYFFPS